MAKIQIIDDDVGHMENLSQILKMEGHEVSTLDDTANAIDALLKNTPDLLLLDVMFPENPAAGFDLARKIRSTEGLKLLPIILETGINQEFPLDFSSDDIDPEWMPVQEFIEKPIDIANLGAKIQALLA